MDRRKSETRPPAPILPVKKPRQALLAHPNNHGYYDEGFASHFSGGNTTTSRNQTPQLLQPFWPNFSITQAASGTWPSPSVSDIPRNIQNQQHRSVMQRPQVPYSNIRTVQAPSAVGQPSEPTDIPYTACQSQNSSFCMPQRPMKCTPMTDFSPVTLGASFSTTRSGGAVNRSTVGNFSAVHRQPRALADTSLTCYPYSDGIRGQHATSGGFSLQASGSKFSSRSLIRPPLESSAAHGCTSVSTLPSGKQPTPSFSIKIKSNDSSSLRFLTCTIKGMKHWSEQKGKLPVMFEVFGAVNSAITVAPSAISVSFVLKDADDSVNCIFYQIDRQLPRVIRGHWYRCVGHYCLINGYNCLKCVSVRLMTESEKRSFKLMISSSDMAMQDWSHHTHEV